MLVCLLLCHQREVTIMHGDDNNDRVQRRKSPRPWDVCVRHIIFSECINTQLILRFLGGCRRAS
jgi:hypothetical protein